MAGFNESPGEGRRGKGRGGTGGCDGGQFGFGGHQLLAREPRRAAGYTTCYRAVKWISSKIWLLHQISGGVGWGVQMLSFLFYLTALFLFPLPMIHWFPLFLTPPTSWNGLGFFSLSNHINYTQVVIITEVEGGDEDHVLKQHEHYTMLQHPWMKLQSFLKSKKRSG